jgi:hypothetical protein
MREKCCFTVIFERDTIFGPHMDWSRLSAPITNKKEQPRCSVAQERFSNEEQRSTLAKPLRRIDSSQRVV